MDGDQWRLTATHGLFRVPQRREAPRRPAHTDNDPTYAGHGSAPFDDPVVTIHATPRGREAGAALTIPMRPRRRSMRQPCTPPGSAPVTWWLCSAYCRGVIVAAALTGVILFIAAGLIWTARLVHVGNLDAYALADKLDKPHPVSALDWPELRVRAVIPQPDGPQPDGPPLVLLHVGWPGHPRQAATLLVALDIGDRRSLSLLSQWCVGQASVAPVRHEGAELELRRRQSLERVHAVMVAEDPMTLSGD
jgi:hypothetical protein